MTGSSNAYIYESPDGGSTVYRRRLGTTERELIQESPLARLRSRSELWRGIFESAEADEALRTMIDQVEVYYRLRNQIQP